MQKSVYLHCTKGVQKFIKIFNILKNKNMKNSDFFKVAGNETVLNNGKNVKVVDYLTASAQVQKGLATKTAGTQVLYVLEIDGKRVELKGSQFAKWCESNGIEIIHKGGSTGIKNKLTFTEEFERLKQKAEKAETAEIKEAVKYLSELLKQREEAEKAALEAEKQRLIEAAKKLGLVLQPKQRNRK